MGWTQVSSGWVEKRAAIETAYGVTVAERDELLIYEAEEARGLVHTQQWAACMQGIRDRIRQRDAAVRQAFASG